MHSFTAVVTSSLVWDFMMNASPRVAAASVCLTYGPFGNSFAVCTALTVTLKPNVADDTDMVWMILRTCVFGCPLLGARGGGEY